MSNFYNSNDFDVMDKKEKSKFIKMKSIFDMPTNKKYINNVNIKERELMQIQKDKEKIVNKPTNHIKPVQQVQSKPESKQVSFKPESKSNNNNNDSMMLINRSKHIKK
jgi:CRISPR/Cas system-associated protein Cas5 (RAMP superfamily)